MSQQVKWLILIVLSLIWGSSFILVKRGLTQFDFIQAATLRLVSAGAVLLPIAVFQWRKVPKEKLPWIVFSGLLGMFFPAYLFCMAQQQVQSAVAGILNALTPAFTFIVAILFFDNKYKSWQIGGLILGLVSAIMLATKGSITNLSLNWYAGLIVVATACYGLNINVIKHYLKGVPPLAISSIAVSSAGGLAFLAVMLPHLQGYQLTTERHWPFAALMTLGVLGTAVAQLLSYQLITNTSALFASTVTYMIPVVAIGWGFLDGETFQLIHLVSIIGILISIFLVKKE